MGLKIQTFSFQEHFSCKSRLPLCSGLIETTPYKAWLDAILYALHKNGVKGKTQRILNSNLTVNIHSRHGLTREIRIRDSIRQGKVLSVIEYATPIGEISEELKEHNSGTETESGEKINYLLWIDDLCLIHHDLKTLQKMMNITNHATLKYHNEFGAANAW